MNKLKYCDKKLSNTSSCSNLATHICIKVNKITLQNEQKSYRCDRNTDTNYADTEFNDKQLQNG